MAENRKILQKEHKELLIKNWMTHDAMWFYHCLQECGIDSTNKINKLAVRSMAVIEIKRIKKLLGIEEIKTFKELKSLIEGAMEIVKADFMDFRCEFGQDNTIHFEMCKCFAYEGINKIGVIEQYKCGIFDRIEGWFDGIGMDFNVTPQVEGCMMHIQGRCFRDFRFNF